MYEGVTITHKKWGKGIIDTIDDGHITVNFGGELKTFVFPDSIGQFLQTDDEQLLSYAEKQKQIKQKQVEKQKEEQKQKVLAKIVAKGSKGGDESDYETPLLGKRSGDILFSSEADFFEAIGYLARPGRISFYQAELTEDKEDQFKKLFPNQDYKVIKSSYGKDGNITKQGCQFRINLASIDNCPVTLLNHISEKNGSWAGRINRSKFALKLVQNYGFSFGYGQNVKKITSLVPNKYEADFIRGFNR